MRIRRRLTVVKQCPECQKTFRPWRKSQVCCSGSCGAVRRSRMHPQHYKMRAAQAVNRALYAKRLGQRLAGMTKGEIWRQAYRRGFVSGWNKATRNNAMRQMSEVA